ncbi:PREDICTED: uncharacterized protein LOC104761911 isoform X2 [Camelina sativa]|uniref:Uncharacterized protein LOC104761911 isoform X2 n=1 Tax=Camelina sativa TaxID=90675 RepID=A0ABM1RIH4_CAMSA|nr:PREDICTED: uncharacterized protein LOC104761911 isoform X2 [Camelina sativa]
MMLAPSMVDRLWWISSSSIHQNMFIRSDDDGFLLLLLFVPRNWRRSKGEKDECSGERGELFLCGTECILTELYRLRLHHIRPVAEFRVLHLRRRNTECVPYRPLSFLKYY